METIRLLSLACLLVIGSHAKPQHHPFLDFVFSPSVDNPASSKGSQAESYNVFTKYHSTKSSPVNFHSDFFPLGAFGFSSSGSAQPSGPSKTVTFQPSSNQGHQYGSAINHPPPRQPSNFLPATATAAGSSFADGFFSSGFQSSGPSSLFDSGFTGSQTLSVPDCGQQPVQCNPNSKYRTIDGTCNNVNNPRQGSPNMPYGRLVPHRYADGRRVPVQSVAGGELPSARLLSTTFFPDAPIYDPIWTLATMQWGQIVTHDMSFGLAGRQAKIHSTDCCSSEGGCLSKDLQLAKRPDSSCYPIDIPANDPFYSKYRQECMDFIRTSTDASRGCGKPYGPARQLNAVTSYMDASLVYGVDQQTADGLRLGQGGRMITEVRQGKEWPPTSTNHTGDCESMSDDEVCYRGGDPRINQNPELTVLQIILLREHNRLADGLAHINPHWDDETLYQEARRILIAEFQHINYYEWIPIILGWDAVFKAGVVYETKGGYTNDYNENVDPSTMDGHATAAFRFFHTQIQGFLEEISKFRHAFNAIRMSDYFNRPQIIEQDGMDQFVRGMSTQPMHGSDRFFTAEITQFLFRAGKPFGMDLRAIDIQRGRDHGLGSYNDYREVCGLPRARDFSDFLDTLEHDVVQKLAQVYAHPDDVELNVGGFLEKLVPGALAGPTFVCIVSEQFRRTRVGDRYFYEHGGQPHSFTPEQLQSIRSASFARLLCDNEDDVTDMQPQAFRQITHDNQVVSCDHLPVVDLRPWQEVGVHYKKKK